MLADFERCSRGLGDLQRRALQLRTDQRGVGHEGVEEQSAAQIGLIQVGSLELRADQPGFAQIHPPEMRAAQLRVLQLCLGQLRWAALLVGPIGRRDELPILFLLVGALFDHGARFGELVGRAEKRFLQLRAFQHRAVEPRAGECRALMRAAQDRAGQIGLAEVGVPQIGAENRPHRRSRPRKLRVRSLP